MQRTHTPDELYLELQKAPEHKQIEFAVACLQSYAGEVRMEDRVAAKLILSNGSQLLAAYLKANVLRLRDLVRHFPDYDENFLIETLFNDEAILKGLFLNGENTAIRLDCQDLPITLVQKCLLRCFQNKSLAISFLRNHKDNLHLVLNFMPELKTQALEHLIKDLNLCREIITSPEEIFSIFSSHHESPGAAGELRRPAACPRDPEIEGFVPPGSRGQAAGRREQPEQLDAILKRLAIDRQWQMKLFSHVRTEEDLQECCRQFPAMAECARFVFLSRSTSSVEVKHIPVPLTVNDLIMSAFEKDDRKFLQDILTDDEFAEKILLSDDNLQACQSFGLFGGDIQIKMMERLIGLQNAFQNAARFEKICKNFDLSQKIKNLPESQFEKIFSGEQGITNLIQFLTLRPELKNHLVERVLNYAEMDCSMFFSAEEYEKFCELVGKDSAYAARAKALRDPIIAKIKEITARKDFPRILHVSDLDETLIDDTEGTMEQLPLDHHPEQAVYYLERFQDIARRFPHVISTIATYGVNKHRAKKILLATGGAHPERRVAAFYTPDLLKFHADTHKVQQVIQHHFSVLNDADSLTDIEATCLELKIEAQDFMRGMVDCFEMCAKDSASDRYHHVGKCFHILLFLLAEFTRENYSGDVVPLVFMDDSPTMLRGVIEKLNACIPIMSKHLKIKIPLVEIHTIEAKSTTDLDGKKIIEGSEKLVRKIESIVLSQLANANLSVDDRSELKSLAPLLQRKKPVEVKPSTSFVPAFEEKKSSISSLPPSEELWKKSDLSTAEQTKIFAQLAELNKIAVKLRECKDLSEQRKNPESEMHLLAILCEEMHRATGKYPYPNQLLSLLSYLAAPNGRRIGEIQTGEGKSLILALLAAHIALTRNEKVHVVPPNAYLSERDYKQFKEFYERVGVSVAFDGVGDFQHLPASLYQNSAVVYTTVEAASQRINEEEKLDLQDRHLILDEADRYFLDLLGESNKKSHPGMLYSPELLKFLWDSRDENEAVSFPRRREPIDGLLNNNDNKLNSDVGSRLRGNDNALISDADLQVLVEALNAAKTMQPDIDYVKNKHHIKIFKTTPHAVFVNYFLRLKENLPLTGHEDLVSSSVPNHEFLRAYKNIWGATGTAGSAEEKAYLKEKFGLSFFTAPLNFIRDLKEEAPLILEDETTWRLTLVDEVLKQAATRPVLLLCNSVAEAEELALMEFKHFNKPVFILDHAKTQDEIAEILKNAVPGTIFIGTHPAPRGLDIQISDEVSKAGGLAVFSTGYPTVERDVDQAKGRAARQGKSGSFRFILCREHLLRRLEKNPPDVLAEVKRQNADISQHKLQLNDSHIALLETVRLADHFYKALNLKDDGYNKRFALNKNYTLINAEDIWAELYKRLDLLVSEFQLEIQQKLITLNLTKSHLDEMNETLRQRVGQMIQDFWVTARIDIALNRPGLMPLQWVQEKHDVIPRSAELIALPWADVVLKRTVFSLADVRSKIAEANRLCAENSIAAAATCYQEVTSMINRMNDDALSNDEKMQLYLIFYDMYALNKRLEPLPPAILKGIRFAEDAGKHAFYLQRIFNTHIELVLKKGSVPEKFAVLEAGLSVLENTVTNETLNSMAVKTIRNYVRLAAEHEGFAAENSLKLIRHVMSSDAFQRFYKKHPYPFSGYEEIKKLQDEATHLLTSIKSPPGSLGVFASRLASPLSHRVFCDGRGAGVRV